MATFAYVGRDSRGASVRGRIEATSDAEARARLRQQGVFITTLWAKRLPGWGRHVPAAEIAALTRYVATMLEAGLTLLDAIQTLEEQIQDQMLRTVVATWAQDIQEGKTLSAALERRSDLFSPVYIGIVRHGEASGRLDVALDRLATYLERDLEYRRRIRDALIYPSLVLALAIVVVTFFVFSVIPAFERVYRNSGAALPMLTRGLMMVSGFIRTFAPVLGVAAVIVILVVTRRRSSAVLREALRTIALRLPYADELVRAVPLSRFTHALGTLVHGGVPLLVALDVAGQAAGVKEFGPVVTSLQTHLRQGQRLHGAMRQTGLFPPMIVRIVALGEESGRLDVMLERASAILDREFDLRMRRFLTFLEPALTVTLGAIIGVILLSLYLPIFGLAKAVVR